MIEKVEISIKGGDFIPKKKQEKIKNKQEKVSILLTFLEKYEIKYFAQKVNQLCLYYIKKKEGVSLSLFL